MYVYVHIYICVQCTSIMCIADDKKFQCQTASHSGSFGYIKYIPIWYCLRNITSAITRFCLLLCLCPSLSLFVSISLLLSLFLIFSQISVCMCNCAFLISAFSNTLSLFLSLSLASWRQIRFWRRWNYGILFRKYLKWNRLLRCSISSGDFIRSTGWCWRIHLPRWWMNWNIKLRSAHYLRFVAYVL